MNPEDFPITLLPPGELIAHPKNYRTHPEDQILELIHSIEAHGWYRPVVLSQDRVILAGHGITLAALRMKAEKIPCIILPIETMSVQALKILAGDNELPKMGMVDDRALTEILKSIKELDVNGLRGTGYDELKLANLVFVTRPETEIGDKEEAAQWAGMPTFQATPDEVYLKVDFESAKEREEFVEKHGFKLLMRKSDKIWSMKWPQRERDDLINVRVEQEPEEKPGAGAETEIAESAPTEQAPPAPRKKKKA